MNALTIGKLTPLVIFIAAGLFAIDPARLTGSPHADARTSSSTTGLLLIFAFGGYEVVPVPAGEARDPRRAVPFALVMTIVIATAVMTLAQVVALGTLPSLTSSKTPLADAAALFLGGAGAALITFGAICSTERQQHGPGALRIAQPVCPRRAGRPAAVLRPVHPRFRTPANAVLVTSGVSLVLALSGTFAVMAAASAITRLARLRRHLRRHPPAPQPRLRGVVKPADLRRPARPGDPGCGDRDRAGDPGRCDVAPSWPLSRRPSLAGAVLYLIAVRGATTRE